MTGLSSCMLAPLTTLDEPSTSSLHGLTALVWGRDVTRWPAAAQLAGSPRAAALGQYRHTISSQDNTHSYTELPVLPGVPGCYRGRGEGRGGGEVKVGSGLFTNGLCHIELVNFIHGINWGWNWKWDNFWAFPYLAHFFSVRLFPVDLVSPSPCRRDTNV